MNSIKNIVVASNPFGFGPTANAIPLLKALQKRFSGRNDVYIYFVGSKECQGILPEFDGIRSVVLDERDTVCLKAFLENCEGDVLAVGVQNRFIVDAGKSVGCKTIFLDVLAWMWQEIPITHLIADEIIWMRFLGIEKQYDRYASKNIHIIEGMYTVVDRKSSSITGSVLFCVGGGFNPLRNGIQENYLRLLARVIRDSKTIYNKIEIATGIQAADFLRNCLRDDSRIDVVTLNHDDFMNRLSHVSNLISVGGQSSTMEAILSGTPVKFFIPSNLSQMALQVKFSQELGDGLLWWKKEFETLLNIVKNTSEKDFIDKLELLSKDILSDDEKVNRLISRFERMMDVSMNVEYSNGISDMGKWIGSQGAEQLANKIEGWL